MREEEEGGRGGKVGKRRKGQFEAIWGRRRKWDLGGKVRKGGKEGHMM